MKTREILNVTRATAVGLVAMLGLVFLTAAARGPKEKAHPVKGSLVGAVWYQYDWKDPGCACESNVTTLTAAAGELSELGAVGMLASHCAPMPPYTKYVGTQMILVTADGELWANYDTEDTGGKPSLVLNFTGGTGRYTHANGSARMDFVAVPQFNADGSINFNVPWPWSAEIDGAIRFHPSNKDDHNPPRPKCR